MEGAQNVDAVTAEKSSSQSAATARIKVAAIAMMLTHCHKCGFHVRSERLTFNFAAWLKGFCAVAALSHAKNSAASVTSISVADHNEAGALLIQLPISGARRPATKTPARRPASYPQ